MVVPLARHVLLVDDVPEICRSISQAIQSFGLECICAYNSDQARALLSNYSFDLYILDLNLDGDSGIALCKEIREKDTVTPVIIFTGGNLLLDRADALRIGASAVVDKARPEDLFSIVRHHFGID